MMTITQFRASRMQTADLHAALPPDVAQYYEDANGAPTRQTGYVYPAHGVIELIGAGVYALTLGNDQRISGDLAALEADLFEWLADDGALS